MMNTTLTPRPPLKISTRGTYQTADGHVAEGLSVKRVTPELADIYASHGLRLGDPYLYGRIEGVNSNVWRTNGMDLGSAREFDLVRRLDTPAPQRKGACRRS